MSIYEKCPECGCRVSPEYLGEHRKKYCPRRPASPTEEERERQRDELLEVMRNEQ